MSQPDSRFRKAALISAAALGVLSIALGVSIAAALFDLPVFFSGPGGFFVDSYGILAFAVPAYLFCAALILADPRYRPDRIFVLSATVLPFLTLALGFAFLRDFEFRAETSRFLAAAGRVGFSFIVIFLTIFEILIIAALKSILFPREKVGTGKKAARERGAAKNNNRAAEQPREKTPLFLPIKNSIKDIYTRAASAVEGSDRKEEHPPAVREAAPKTPVYEMDLPEPKPLSSAETFRKMENPELYDEDSYDPDAWPEGDIEARRREYEDSLGYLEAPDDEEIEDLEPLEPADDGSEAFLAAVRDKNRRPAADSPAGIIEPEESHIDSDLEKALSDAEAEASQKTREAKEKHDADHGEEVKKRRRRGPYKIPVEGILTEYPDGEYWIIDQATRDAAVTLKETLKEFNIQAEVTGIRKGPVITMFEILPAPGVKLSKIVNLQDNIALRLAASSVRIVAPIPGKHAVGIEVPNVQRNIVSFREIIEGELKDKSKKKPEVPVVLGKGITGEAQIIDLVQTPHLLIAGATGSGKSVCVNSMILSILYQLSPAECRLILIDPKIVELKLYNDIPHLLTPVITEPKKAFQALQYCIYEMERRYACLDSMGVRDIRSYNRRIKERNIAAEHMPYIVVVIDEFADLMATTGKELESTVARLAAMSRAVGVHLVLATQRPSIDVITGLIKANIPSRIAFMVASKMDSRIIIDMVGAEKLLGKGDMLYAGVVDPFPIRMQGAFVSEEEVEKVVEYVKTLGEPDYIDEEIFFEDDEDDMGPSLFSDGEDPLYEKALEIVMSQGKASASYIQRRLKIGYNRAARLVEEMEIQGIVGPAQGSKPREVLRGL
ncbi:DNA translocase FtsK [Breznakiella homolactica]|uniref:DNA translocase FtsK n=1 Tax=Breznakiella homolactica TaxID=2798577 RepID=A0A7T8BDJ8_9SPIR|nr:DNA translocase FtsK [Breznakiella homolactica]